MSRTLASGHVAEDVTGEELEQQKIFRYVEEYGLVRLNPGRWFLTEKFLQNADNYFNFKFRATDVIVMTYPKSGTTWMQEIIWMMRNNPNLDHPLQDTHNFFKTPFFEWVREDHLETHELQNSEIIKAKLGDSLSIGKKMQLLAMLNQEGKGASEPKEFLDDYCLRVVESTPDPRTLRTHLPFSLLNPQLLDTAKVVCMLRNPKDVCVSYHHHSRLLKSIGFKGSFDQFFEFFINDQLSFSPFWGHVEDVWTRRNHPNLHIIFYEDLKADVMGELRKLNAFLNTDLSEQQLQRVAEYTSFSQMKARSEAEKNQRMYNMEVKQTDGGFFRKGEVGDGKRLLSELQQKKIDLWISEHNSKLQVPFK